MMRFVDEGELITADMFMRPLVPEAEDRNVTRGWTDEPINSLLWVPVKARLGPVWMGRPVSEFVKKVSMLFDGSWREVPDYEFALDVPSDRATRNAPPVWGWNEGVVS